MKQILSIIIVLFSSCFFAQDKSKNPSFEVIQNVPVYSGCDKTGSNAEITKCMTDKIFELISKNFNTDLANETGLPEGLVEIVVIFKVNQHGKITDVKSEGPYPLLEKEATRVINLIPDMERPALQRGKPVTVPYTFPINFIIDKKKRN